MGCSVLRHDQTCLVGAAGEALEAELNKTGPGSCKFVRSDISKEEDIKVKCSFVWNGKSHMITWWSHDDLTELREWLLHSLRMCICHLLVPLVSAEADCSHSGAVWSHRLPGQQRRLAWVFCVCVVVFLLTRRHDNKAVLLTVCFCVWNLPLQTLLINPLTTPQQRSSETCWIWTSSATFWRLKYVFTALGANNFCLRW